MASFVLVHGLGFGGWVWKRVAGRLRAQGHAVFTPTLTGVGERSHLASKEVDLETHVTDVVSVLKWEDLEDVVLVGHSYGGSVVTGAADRASQRIRHLIYLDAFVLEDGESVMSLQPPERVAFYEELVREKGDGWLLPPNPAAFYGLKDEDDQKWLDALCTPQPFATMTSTLRLRHAGAPAFGRTYVRAAEFTPSPFGQFADRFRHDPDWRYREIEGGHMLMVSHPGEVVEILASSPAVPVRKVPR